MNKKISSGFMLLFILRSTVCIPLDQFYPFGNTRVTSGDDNSSPLISLQKEFLFFNQSHTVLYVNTNGAISFKSAVSQFTSNPFPLDGNRMLIAVFWGNVDTRGTGAVWYHGSTDNVLLSRASMEIRNAFPAQADAGFTATDLFIATWNRVGYYSRHTDLTNTFQCVLVTDGSQSFVMFLYADGLIQWTTGDSYGGSNGVGGTPAQVGFNAGDGINFAAVPESRTAEIINIDTTSNIGVPGVWAFQVNEAVIVEPNACMFMGAHYQDGEQVQPNCSTQCTCQQGQFRCQQQTCFADGPTCYATGDPHYQTFDLRYYDFQGDCEYILTTPCNTSEFTVIVGNSAHNSFMSSTETVMVLVPDENREILLGRDNGGTVTINGNLQSNNGDGIIMQSSAVEILRSGGHPHILLLTYGVRIFWDGLYRVEVTVSQMWQNRLCGLCGNFNNDASDDFKMPDGSSVLTENAFGNSWLYTNASSGCGGLSVPPICLNNIMAEAQSRCEVMTQTVFASCNAVVDPTPFIENCLFDFCLCNDKNIDDCFCDSLATYAAACAAAGVPPSNWRRFYCPIQCPPGMVFQQCGSLCPQTCGSSTTCNSGCAEGCFCPDGQVINSNGLCTNPRECLGMLSGPRFMVPLQSKEILCYSIRGYPGFPFNLIYNKNFIINAYFKDSMVDKNEATWIRKLAVIPRNGSNSNAVIFDFVNQEVIMVGQGSFEASVIQKITFELNGKMSVKFIKGVSKRAGNPTVHVTYTEPQADFDVNFHKNHLSIDWNQDYDNFSESEGLMGQFMTKDIDIDVQKQILIYHDGRDPVPVTKDTRITGNFNKQCWTTTNAKIQGENLIKGNIRDYVVSNILEDDFAFKRK